jgi:hypothetical protein
MNTATYNLRKGGAARTHWATLIEQHAVDLLLLQESYPPDIHLPPLMFPAARERAVWDMVESNGWGSAIFSRDGSLEPIAVPGFPGWVVGAEISGAAWQSGRSEATCVFSIHAPSRVGSYSKQVNKLLDAIGQVAAGREIILGGDFNLTISPGLETDRPVSKADRAIQARLADEFQLLNCWRAANLAEPLQQTLRWSSNKTIPYHCDGLFVPRSWQARLQSCCILTGDDWNRLSDHNPVVATFA